MTCENAYDTIVNEGDHLGRMPAHEGATPLCRRDYIRGRLLLMIARETMHRAEYEGPETPKKRRRY